MEYNRIISIIHGRGLDAWIISRAINHLILFSYRVIFITPSVYPVADPESKNRWSKIKLSEDNEGRRGDVESY